MLPWPLSCLCWVNALENRSFSGCCGHCCRWQKREYSAQCVVVFFNLHMALSGVEPTAAPPLFSMPWSSSRGSPPSALTIRAVVSNLPLPAPSIPAFQEWHSSHQHQGYCSSGSWPVIPVHPVCISHCWCCCPSIPGTLWALRVPGAAKVFPLGLAPRGVHCQCLEKDKEPGELLRFESRFWCWCQLWLGGLWRCWTPAWSSVEAARELPWPHPGAVFSA